MKATKLKRGELINLFNIIQNIKSTELPKDAKIEYTLLRVKLRGLLAKFEKARTDISEETKPAGWKEGDSTEEWDMAFRPVIQKWLEEESDIDTKILSLEDCIALIGSNPDRDDAFGDVIIEFLSK